MAEALNIQYVANVVDTKRIGCRFYYYPEIDSTNNQALLLGQQGASDGTVIIADYQLVGRGRANRQWVSSEKTNLLFSVILKPANNNPHEMTMLAAVAVHEVLSQILTASEVVIKWPNDILVDNQKICGILAETQTKGEQSSFIVVGIGLNINMSAEDIPENINRKITSLSICMGRGQVSREEVLVKVLYSLDKWYDKILTGSSIDLTSQYIQNSNLHGRLVSLQCGNEIIKGFVTHLDEQGKLWIRDEYGRTNGFVGGEILKIF